MNNGGTVSTLTEYFRESGTELFAALPVRWCRIIKEYLMRGEWQNGHALFVLVPYCTPRTEGGYDISAYARVKDYHIFMKELLGTAADYLNKKYPGSFSAGFSDHSPVDERLGAAEAGLGVLGRNGLLITKPYSSFVFIGEIMTSLGDAELAAEGVTVRSGEAEMCIGCGRCAAACPGGCIGGMGECLSAVTQKKGELSESEREAVIRGGSIWGCDVCQNVCPYTAAAKAAGTLYTAIPYFRDSVLTVSDGTVEGMSDGEFREYPFSWRKREVILRNIALISGSRR